MNAAAVATTGGAVRQRDGGMAREPTRITLDVAMKQVDPNRSTIDRWRRRGLPHSYRAPDTDRRVQVDVEQLQASVRNPLVRW